MTIFKKQIIIFVALFTMILVVSGCNFKQDNQDNKQTNKNDSEELVNVKIDDLSIEIPKGWILINEPDSHSTYIIKSPKYIPINNNKVSFKGEIYINRIENKNKLSILDLISSFDDTSRFWPQKYEYTEMTLNERELIIFDKINDGKYPRKSIFVNMDNNVYNFSYIYEEEKNPEVEKIFDNVVKSFNK